MYNPRQFLNLFSVSKIASSELVWHSEARNELKEAIEA